MSFYYNSNRVSSDYRTPEELGKSYERCVASYFEEKYNCLVVPQGQLLGFQDGGIDLVAVAPDKTYLVQCKYYKKSHFIHENVVNQLSGAARVFSHKHPDAKNVKAVVIMPCKIADDAVTSALINEISWEFVDYQPATPKLFTKHTIEELSISLKEYNSRLNTLISCVQCSNTDGPVGCSYKRIFDEFLMDPNHIQLLSSSETPSPYDVKAMEDSRKPVASLEDYLPPLLPSLIFLSFILTFMLGLVGLDFVSFNSLFGAEADLYAFSGCAAIGGLFGFYGFFYWLGEWKSKLKETKQTKRKRSNGKHQQN